MTAIVITLAAVVLLILVIGFFAMRFLRAESVDPFDEDLPDERGRSRGDAEDHDRRGNDRVATMDRRSGGSSRAPRRQAGDPRAKRPDRRSRANPEPARSARDYDERQYAAADRQPPARLDDRGALDDRGFDDRGFDDSSFSGRSRGGQRPAAAPAAASPRMPQSLPADRPAASARSGRAKGAGGGGKSGTDWDSLSDVDYWAELASDKPLTTTAQQAGPAQPAGPGSRPDLASRSALNGTAAPNGTARPNGAVAPGAADAPDASTALLPVRQRHAPAGLADSPGLPGARRGRAAADLPDDASDRTGQAAIPAQPSRVAAAGRRRGGIRPDSPGSASRRQRDPSAAPYGDPRDPRGRSSGGPGPAPALGSDEGLAALARLSNGTGNGNGYGNTNEYANVNGYGNGNGHLNGSGHANGNGHGRPVPLDDDPLTSPSFPAVSAADGRSYRGGRPETQTPGSRGPGDYATGAQQAAAAQAAAQQAAAQQAAAQQAAAQQAALARQALASQQTAAYPAVSPDPAGYGSRGAGGRPSDTGAGQSSARRSSSHRSDNGRSDWADGYAPRANGASEGPGQDGYRAGAPAPAAASYHYGEPPLANSNPYGSYVSAPVDGYPAAAASSHPDSDVAYGGYPAGQDTQRYSQPPPRHLAAAPPPVGPSGHATPLHPVPMYAAPVPSAPTDQPAPGYEEYRYDAPGSNGVSGDYGGGSSGEPAAAVPGPPEGGRGQSAGGYQGGRHSHADYPPAAQNGRPYDQPAYLPTDSAGPQHDQPGYGTPDSGYGAGTYGSYPGY
jgi:hypothetical protein